MKLNNLEEIKNYSDSLKNEYAHLCELIYAKKSEIESLSVESELSIPGMSHSLEIEKQMLNKIEELKEINKKIELLKIKQKKAKDILDDFFISQNKISGEPAKKATHDAVLEDKILKITNSIGSNNMLDKIFASNPVKIEAQIQEQKKSFMPKEKNIVKPDSVPVKEELKLKQNKKTNPSEDLYKKAQSEAAAQEKFLKSQSSKFSKSA